MSLPEGYLPRKGDELLIRVKVDFDVDHGEDDVHIRIVGANYKTAVLNVAHVYALHQRTWSVGEKVAFSEFTGPGEVVAVHGDQVWVKNLEKCEDYAAGLMLTADANDLKPWVDLADDDMVAIGEAIAYNYPDAPPMPPCGGAIGSQSIVGDDDPIAVRDEAANR